MESRDRSFSGLHSPAAGQVSDVRDLDPFGTLHEKHYRLPRSEMIALLGEARRRLLALVEPLDDEQLMGPQLPPVSPQLWAIGHIAFFYEAMVLRTADASPPGFLPDADEIFDSFRVSHDDRWNRELCPLPPRAEVMRYLRDVSASLVNRLEGRSDLLDPVETYLNLYAIIHEHWHLEDFIHTRQLLGYPEPSLFEPPAEVRGGGPLPGDVEVPGGRFTLGASRDAPWVFDAERWAHPVQIERFRIARAPVTNEEYLRFVEAGGYDRRELWSYEGWRWRIREDAEGPMFWTRRGGTWMTRHFEREVPLAPHKPVVHVSWYEAEAYCRWAGRRLPTEAEWEAAAAAEPAGGDGLSARKRPYPWGEGRYPSSLHGHARIDARVNGTADVADYPQGDSAFGCRQMLGNVWEWTTTAFYPFPGFVMDFPYRENSAPWFGYRKVARGGCWATSALVARNMYRHSFWPEQRSNFVGFRTCAP